MTRTQLQSMSDRELVEHALKFPPIGANLLILELADRFEDLLDANDKYPFPTHEEYDLD